MLGIVEEESLEHIRGEQIDTTITRPDVRQSKGKVLLLHGAGESTKDRLLPMARGLSARGWECLTFSLPGHGASSGELLGSTLHERKQVTQELADKCGFLEADRVVGVSMGAHTAISLLKDHPSFTQHLALFVPAIYSRHAEHVPFGPEFSKVLRTPKSYLEAESWDILPVFKGNLAIVQAGMDEVIPHVIIEKLQQVAHAAERVHHVVVEDSPHRITTWMAEEQHRVEAFCTAIDRFEFGGLHTAATNG